MLLLTSRKHFKADAYANLGTHHANIHFILPYQEAGQYYTFLLISLFLLQALNLKHMS